MKAAFWIAALGLAIPLYVYLAYPALLFIAGAVVQVGRDLRYLILKGDRRRRGGRLPSVSLIVAAHNEEAVIERTIRNLLSLDYPRDQLEILIGSDGSSDRTVALLRGFESDRLRVIEFAERRGKLAVITDCARSARGEVLVFSDANTLLRPDALRRLVRHFDSPRVGVVCGELRLRGPHGRSGDEGFYWRYEVTLKLLESRLDAMLGANGAIYAVRRELFPVLPAHLITDDFVIPMKIRGRGFSVVYDPEAVAVEETTDAVAGEFRRRVRIGAGNWQALWHCRELLLPWKGFVAVAFWSHKVLRWLTPFLLPPAFVASGFMTMRHPFWQAAFAAQICFYGGAAVGGLLSRGRRAPGPFRAAYYFLAINTALAIGMIRGMLGLQRPAWQRTVRGAAQGGTPS